MNLNQIKSFLPETNKNVIVVLSGGLDSSVATMILVDYYGADRVKAVSFNYGQKQKIELQKASELCSILNIDHRILDLSILGEIARPFSANISGSEIETPDASEIIGDPQPKTYVPNRNMIMYSIVAAIAEVEGAGHIFCGLQLHDIYGYWDTTTEWVSKINETLSLNRKSPIKLVAPFSQLSKYDEIKLVEELGKLNLLKHTITCYNPNELGESCGRCGSCEERLVSFRRAGIKDPIPYAFLGD